MLKKVFLLISFLCGCFFLCGFSDNDTADKAERYALAQNEFEAGQFESALYQFIALGDYEDSKTRVLECRYLYASQLLDRGEYEMAKILFSKNGDYEDSKEMAKECRYRLAITEVVNENYSGAISVFKGIRSYKDSADFYALCNAFILLEKREDQAAYDEFCKIESPDLKSSYYSYFVSKLSLNSAPPETITVPLTTSSADTNRKYRIVYVSNNGIYHTYSNSCGMKYSTPLPMDEAEALGYRACEHCYK